MNIKKKQAKAINQAVPMRYNKEPTAKDKLLYNGKKTNNEPIQIAIIVINAMRTNKLAGNN